MTTIRSVEMGNPLHILQEAMSLWKIESSKFHLQLEDREHINFHNIRTIKQFYQATVKLTETSPTMLLNSIQFTLYNQLQVRTMSATPLSEFCLATLSTFGALYE